MCHQRFFSTTAAHWVKTCRLKSVGGSVEVQCSTKCKIPASVVCYDLQGLWTFCYEMSFCENLEKEVHRILCPQCGLQMKQMENMTQGRECYKKPSVWGTGRARGWPRRGSRKALLTGGGRCLPSAELAVLARYGEAGEGLREGAGLAQGANGRGGEASFSTTRPQVSSR